MAKYHAYSAKTSDGRESVKGYSHKQMMKFVQDRNGLPTPWLVVQESDRKGNAVLVQRVDEREIPVTATIEHTHEEIDFAAEAQARGLQAVRCDAAGKVLATEDPPYVKTYGVGKSGETLIVVEVRPAKPKTVAEVAAEAEAEVAALEAQLAAKKAALKK